MCLEKKVLGQIIPPDINPEIDGVPIIDLPSVELLDLIMTASMRAPIMGIFCGSTYTIILNAQTSRRFIHTFKMSDNPDHQIITGLHFSYTDGWGSQYQSRRL